MATLTLTVIGDDRPGLVSTVSELVHAHGGNWERSRMSRMAGKFAGIVLVTVPADRLDALVAELVALADEGLQVTVERTDEPRHRDALHFRLGLLGSDHPGIVARVSAALSDRGVSIEELTTDARDAPMAGGTVFEAQAVLHAPSDLSADELRSMLEGLAHDLMVDLTLSDE